MDLRRQYIGEAVQRQRRLVRDHPSLLGPEPGGDQLFVLPNREVYEAVDPPLRPRHSAREDVLAEQVGGVARLGGLLCRDVPGLTGGGLEQPVPIRPLGFGRRHAQNVTHGSVLCKRTGAVFTVGNSEFRFVWTSCVRLGLVA